MVRDRLRLLIKSDSSIIGHTSQNSLDRSYLAEMFSFVFLVYELVLMQSVRLCHRVFRNVFRNSQKQLIANRCFPVTVEPNYEH